ncbi:MAG TPA: pirin family protein [Pseudomonadales bacterium]|nr:pirin family protein [Pseudomonadales bacterium]
MSTRHVRQILNSRASTDGDGVRIQRTLGEHRYDMDPFLMLDEIRSADSADYVGGFPPHPHRGIETLTYMLAGGFVHEDNMGNREELRDGGAQWMSAGRGVIHSELPLIHEGLLHGFQLWINLPAAQKMQPAAYKQATRDALPSVTLDNGTVLRAFGGSWEIAGKKLVSPLDNFSANARTLDVSLPADTALQIPVVKDDTVLVYVFEGSLQTERGETKKQHLLRYSSGEKLALAAGSEGARVLVLTGTPLGEPIVQYGPFVMNTEAEIRQAVEDYRNNRLV